MALEDGFTFDLNEGKKTLTIQVTGKFVPEKEQQFINEYTSLVKKITPNTYTLYLDANEMKVVSQRHIDNLVQTLLMYKKTGFSKISLEVNTSAIVKMQLNRLAKENNIPVELIN